jgi:hypothetical protein
MSLRSLTVIGIHPVVPTRQQFDDALKVMWGEGLRGKELEKAKRDVQEHFDGLYLLEIEIEPPDADIDWTDLTQPVEGKPRENWQVPWDERRIGTSNRWAFFLHYVDLKRPLQTPIGDRKLPGTTPIPPHLQDIVYDVPG